MRLLSIRQFHLNKPACTFASQGTSEPWVTSFRKEQAEKYEVLTLETLS